MFFTVQGFLVRGFYGSTEEDKYQEHFIIEIDMFLSSFTNNM